MEDKIRLRVLGLTFSQIQTGAYALILAQVDGPYRIPVVIGAAEAQSIAIILEGVKTPRPMTHDLFESFTHAFGIKLESVLINKFEDGIFSSELTFSDGERPGVIDSRTSDAIAIALRAKAPIYTVQEVIDEAGFEMEVVSGEENEVPDFFNETEKEPRLENYAIEELERTLAKLIENEEYEEAAKVQAILNKKRDENRPE